MNDEEMIDRAWLRDELESVVMGIGKKKLRLDPAVLSEYCRLTGHDPAPYEERDEVPAGYLLTFTDPVVSELFLNFFLKHPKAIKGVIHTSSEIRHKGAVRAAPGEYTGEGRILGLAPKQGRKGGYLALDFEVALFDSGGDEIFSDKHQFFLKV